MECVECGCGAVAGGGGAFVLTVAKVTRGQARGYAQYLDGRTTGSQLGDYYLKDGDRIEAPGRWAAGVEHFGLDLAAPVTREQLRTLMDARRPDTGAELRRVGASGEAVAAIDATFSAPKSVSAVWAVGDAQLRAAVEQVHEAAVDLALGYATRQVPMLRRRIDRDRVVHEKANGLVATSWRHTTARAVADQVPDPQLHSHVLLHAAVRRDGRLVAIDSRCWLVHQREVGAAYRTELARGMSELGFAIRRGTGRGGRYFELEGIPQGLIDSWSSRRHEVRAAIEERLAREGNLGGPLSPKQERMMATITRNAKRPVTSRELDAQWRRTAQREGITVERVLVLAHQNRGPLQAVEADAVLDALTEFDATFPAHDARAVALERSAGVPAEAALRHLQTLRAQGEILLLADGSGTTHAHRGREAAAVAITERLGRARAVPIPAAVTLREVKRLDYELGEVGGRLSDEQRAAIELACGDRALVVIEGQAGTGKSTTLTGIARAHQASGRRIIVTSTAGLAAERLANEFSEHGVDCEAYSSVGLAAAIRSGRVELTTDMTVIHDEAALASTREQLNVLRAVERSGARLIEVGDPQQNQPVGAGGLWSRIEDATREAGAHVELTRNQRARDPADRRDQARFRGGQVEHAVRGYQERGRIHLEREQPVAEDRALEAADRDRVSGRSTIVIAQTSNSHLDELNARAQAIRLQHGELGEDGMAVPGRPYELHGGDLVQIRRTIADTEQGVVRNGTAATVADVKPGGRTVELELRDGGRMVLDAEEVAAADVRLAYVQHPFPAQGQTTDTAHLIVGDGATAAGTYVAITRARERTDLYGAEVAEMSADERLVALSERLGRSEAEVPSIQKPVAARERERERVWPGRQVTLDAEGRKFELAEARGFGIEP